MTGRCSSTGSHRSTWRLSRVVRSGLLPNPRLERKVCLAEFARVSRALRVDMHRPARAPENDHEDPKIDMEAPTWAENGSDAGQFQKDTCNRSASTPWLEQ